jgi:hypothetical protein
MAQKKIAEIKIVNLRGRAISDREARLVAGGKIIARSDFQASSPVGRSHAIDLMIAAAEKRGYELKPYEE